MQTNFNLDNFISTFVTKRPQSLLADDFAKYTIELNKRINGKKVLVIGRAGLKKTVESFQKVLN